MQLMYCKMKGISHAVIGLLIVVSAFGSVFAQKGLKLGIVALPQTTWMLNKDDQTVPQDQFKYKTTFGMAVGPSIGYHFGDGVGLKFNFIYSAEGQKYTNFNGEGTLVNHTRRLDYMKIPLFISLNTGTEFHKVVFAADLGFQVNFLMRARYTNDDQSYTPDEILYNPNVRDYPSSYKQYSLFNYGPVASVGADIKLAYNIMGNIRLRGDYTLQDAENKDSAYKLYTNGIPDDVRIYDQKRAITNNLTGGLMFGITYTFTTY
jgi:Outer membrane protein beta-barrel domain